jgi:glycosyltransferase involved in cell wall biosynthesis
MGDTPKISHRGFPYISIVVPTRDRLPQLKRCLEALSRQLTKRTWEVIVIDNARRSAGTRELLASFPDVRLVQEDRPGLSYARNAGIRVAQGEIVVLTDDDTEAAPEWLEHLVRPFERPEIAAVTGNTLARKLESPAEVLFEAYGGLSRGDSPRDFGPEWLRSRWCWLPLWRIGSTANAAFRAKIFNEPGVGLMEERLGAGSPAGAWEDLYFFYRILRCGYTITYEPAAVVRHAHRETIAELANQLQAYRRGEVVFCLLLLGRHRDWRAIPHLSLWIPYWKVTQVAGELVRRIADKRRFSLRILAREWWGYLQGPSALVTSLRRGNRG